MSPVGVTRTRQRDRVTPAPTHPPLFWPGDAVKVRRKDIYSVHAPPPLARPGYATGTVAVTVGLQGEFVVLLDHPLPEGVVMLHVRAEDMLLAQGPARG